LSLVQGFEVLAVLALVVAIAAGVGLYVVFRRLQRYHRNQYVIMGSRGNVDIVEHVAAMDDKMANMRVALEDLTLVARDHDVRIDGTLSRIGVVRFDAYQDLGGRQSAAVAFLNSLGNGVVITTVVSRDFARMYVKTLRDGQPDIPLAPEEIEAVDQARARAPFTIRPRMEEAPAEEPAGEAQSTEAPLLDDEAGRELERENRRRERQGLPALEELPPPPSTRGWQALDVPTGEPGPALDPEGDGAQADERTLTADVTDNGGAPLPKADAEPAGAGSADDEGPAAERSDRETPRKPDPDDLWFHDDDDPEWPARRGEDRHP